MREEEWLEQGGGLLEVQQPWRTIPPRWTGPLATLSVTVHALVCSCCMEHLPSASPLMARGNSLQGNLSCSGAGPEGVCRYSLLLFGCAAGPGAPGAVVPGAHCQGGAAPARAAGHGGRGAGGQGRQVSPGINLLSQEAASALDIGDQREFRCIKVMHAAVRFTSCACRA